MGAADATTAVGEALAAELGWRTAASDDAHALQEIVAGVLGRRQHLVITTRPLSAEEHAIVRGDLHGVRFVDLLDQRGTASETVVAIRRDFGL